jgi:Spy/CpxP family protein refolding chaperone
MNHSRRITVMLAGLAATVATFSAAAPSARAAPVPPPATGAPQGAGGQHQQCPSAVAAQLQIGKAWEHRRKFGGVGPAVGGRCALNKDAHHIERRI